MTPVTGEMTPWQRSVHRIKDNRLVHSSTQPWIIQFYCFVTNSCIKKIERAYLKQSSQAIFPVVSFIVRSETKAGYSVSQGSRVCFNLCAIGTGKNILMLTWEEQHTKLWTTWDAVLQSLQRMEMLLSFCHPVRFPRQCITLFFQLNLRKKKSLWNVILQDITVKVVINGLAIANLLYIYAWVFILSV